MILGSARSISETRKCLLPLFPQKGYSICRLLYQKFCSLTTFPEKIVVLYLVNDLVATGRKTYPGTLLSISLPPSGLSDCIKSYLDLMLDGIVRAPSFLPEKLRQLLDLWDAHRLYGSNPAPP